MFTVWTMVAQFYSDKHIFANYYSNPLKIPGHSIFISANTQNDLQYHEQFWTSKEKVLKPRVAIHGDCNLQSFIATLNKCWVKSLGRTRFQKYRLKWIYFPNSISTTSILAWTLCHEYWLDASWSQFFTLKLWGPQRLYQIICTKNQASPKSCLESNENNTRILSAIFGLSYPKYSESYILSKWRKKEILGWKRIFHWSVLI